MGRGEGPDFERGAGREFAGGARGGLVRGCDARRCVPGVKFERGEAEIRLEQFGVGLDRGLISRPSRVESILDQICEADASRSIKKTKSK